MKDGYQPVAENQENAESPVGQNDHVLNSMRDQSLDATGTTPVPSCSTRTSHLQSARDKKFERVLSEPTVNLKVWSYFPCFIIAV